MGKNKNKKKNQEKQQESATKQELEQASDDSANQNFSISHFNNDLQPEVEPKKFEELGEMPDSEQ